MIQIDYYIVVVVVVDIVVVLDDELVLDYIDLMDFDIGVVDIVDFAEIAAPMVAVGIVVVAAAAVAVVVVEPKQVVVEGVVADNATPPEVIADIDFETMGPDFDIVLVGDIVVEGVVADVVVVVGVVDKYHKKVHDIVAKISFVVQQISIDCTCIGIMNNRSHTQRIQVQRYIFLYISLDR